MQAVQRIVHEPMHFSWAGVHVFGSSQPHAPVQVACALMHGCPHSADTFFSQSALQPFGAWLRAVPAKTRTTGRATANDTSRRTISGV